VEAIDFITEQMGKGGTHFASNRFNDDADVLKAIEDLYEIGASTVTVQVTDFGPDTSDTMYIETLPGKEENILLYVGNSMKPDELHKFPPAPTPLLTTSRAGGARGMALTTPYYRLWWD
jgi:hypothetical protein